MQNIVIDSMKYIYIYIFIYLLLYKCDSCRFNPTCLLCGSQEELKFMNKFTCDNKEKGISAEKFFLLEVEGNFQFFGHHTANMLIMKHICSKNK